MKHGKTCAWRQHRGLKMPETKLPEFVVAKAKDFAIFQQHQSVFAPQCYLRNSKTDESHSQAEQTWLSKRQVLVWHVRPCRRGPIALVRFGLKESTELKWTTQTKHKEEAFRGDDSKMSPASSCSNACNTVARKSSHTMGAEEL